MLFFETHIVDLAYNFIKFTGGTLSPSAQVNWSRDGEDREQPITQQQLCDTH